MLISDSARERLYEAVRNAISEGYTPNEFMCDVKQFWREILHDNALLSDKYFEKVGPR